MDNEELEKDTLETTEAEETPEATTSVEEQETLETSEKPKENQDLYERAKKAEAENKALKKALEAKKGGSEVDIADLAEKMSALSGLDAAERQRVLKEATLQDVPLGEARKSEDFKLWRSAYRAKVEKDKAPLPSTKQNLSQAEKPWHEMTPDEKVEWVKSIRIKDPKTGEFKNADLLPRAFRQQPRG